MQTLYLFRTVYVLACVEEVKKVSSEHIEHHDGDADDNSLEREWLMQLHTDQPSYFIGDSNSLRASDYRSSSTIHTRTSSLTLRLMGCLRVLQPTLKLLFVYPQQESCMITRDLYTSIRQLRYHSGHHFFVIRAVVPYLVYYAVFPFLLRFLSLLIPYGSYILFTVQKDSYLWTNTWEYWVIGLLKAVSPILMQHLWTFHTLYCLRGFHLFKTLTI